MWALPSGLAMYGLGPKEAPQQQVQEHCAPFLRTSTPHAPVLTGAASPWVLLLQSITGSKMEKVCDMCHITLNKNAVVGDVSAMTPGGCRIGTPAMTSRGLTEQVRRLHHALVQTVVHAETQWLAAASVCCLLYHSLVSVCRGALVGSCAATVGAMGIARQGVDETGGLLQCFP